MQKKICKSRITIALAGDPDEISAFGEQLTFPRCTSGGVELFTIEHGAISFFIWNMSMYRFDLKLHEQVIEGANIIVYINPHPTDMYLCENVKQKNNLWFTLSFKSAREIPTNFLGSLIAVKNKWESENESYITFPQKWMLIKSGAKTNNNKPLNPKCLFNTLPKEITDKILMVCHRINTSNYSTPENINLFFQFPFKKNPETDLKEENRRTCIMQ